MVVKDVLVQVDDTPEAAARVALAARLAASQEARLTGLCVRPELEVPIAARASGDTRLEEVLARASVDSLDRVRDLFENSAAGVPNHRWIEVEGEPGSVIGAVALHSDLVVVGPADGERAGVRCCSAIVLSGAPTLTVPPEFSGDVPFRRVLIAWNGGREAARAVRHGLPFLKSAEAVEILIVGTGAPRPGGGGHAPGSGLAEYLDLHRVATNVKIVVPDHGKSVAALILERAGTFGADLIVMGGYGRSRAREVLIGSTTHQLLSRAGVPILVAH